MAVRIEETVELRAPVELVWGHLCDVRELAHCLPGAELTGARDARTHDGRITVRVGPVAIRYAGTATVEECDDAARRVRIVAEGRETSGDGSARIALVATVHAGTPMQRVHLDADVALGGRIAEFGGPMIESVARQLLRQMADCMRATVEPRASAAMPAEGGAGATHSLSGAFREHPMLRDTAVGMRAPEEPAPRAARAMPGRRETAPMSLLPALWSAAVERLRTLAGRPPRH